MERDAAAYVDAFDEARRNGFQLPAPAGFQNVRSSPAMGLADSVLRRVTVRTAAREFGEHLVSMGRKRGRSSVNRNEGKVRLIERLLTPHGVVADIDDETVLKIRDSMAEAGLSMNTQSSYLITLREFFSFAEGARLISANPALAIHPVGLTNQSRKAVSTKPDAWEVPAVLAVADFMPWQFRVALITMLVLGLRPGELLGLTLDSIDLDEGTVHVRAQGGARYADREGGYAEWVPWVKTSSSNRIVLIPKQLRELLRRYLAVTQPQIFDADDEMIRHIGPEFRVFTINGRPMSQVALCAALEAALAGTGKSPEQLGYEITPRSMRSNAISIAFNEGAVGIEVSAWAGHSTPLSAEGASRVTQRHYVRPTEGWRVRMRELWEGVLDRDAPDLIDRVLADGRDSGLVSVREASEMSALPLELLRDLVARDLLPSQTVAASGGNYSGLRSTDRLVSLKAVLRVASQFAAREGDMSATEFATLLAVPVSRVYRWLDSGLVRTHPVVGMESRPRGGIYLIARSELARVRVLLQAEDREKRKALPVRDVVLKLGLSLAKVNNLRRAGVLDSVSLPYHGETAYVTKRSVNAYLKTQFSSAREGTWVTLSKAATLLGSDKSTLLKEFQGSEYLRKTDGRWWLLWSEQR